MQICQTIDGKVREKAGEEENANKPNDRGKGKRNGR